MDPRAINKTIELYKARAEKIRAEYREKQAAEAAKQADATEAEGAGQAEPMQTQDTHQQEASA